MDATKSYESYEHRKSQNQLAVGTPCCWTGGDGCSLPQEVGASDHRRRPSKGVIIAPCGVIPLMCSATVWWHSQMQEGQYIGS